MDKLQTQKNERTYFETVKTAPQDYQKKQVFSSTIVDNWNSLAENVGKVLQLTCLKTYMTSLR